MGKWGDDGRGETAWLWAGLFFPSVSRFLVSDFSFLISCLCSMYVPSEKVGEVTSPRSGTQLP